MVTFIVASSAVIEFIVAFGLNKIVSCEGLKGGGLNYFEIYIYIYLNDYAEFDREI